MFVAVTPVVDALVKLANVEYRLVAVSPVEEALASTV